MRATIKMLSLVAGTFLGGTAHAHISIASGPATADKTQEIAFGVGHGCEGADTYKVTVDIPAGVASVRPLRSDFGKVSVQKDMAGAVTAVSWEKPLAEALDADISYYKMIVRMRMPNKPFTQIAFSVHQTCRAANGTMSTVDWVGTSGDHPGAVVTIVPLRRPGWNKYSVAEHIPNPAVFFNDAQIVWRGTAAWSENPETMAQIKGTPGVTELTDGIHPDNEIWVRY